MSADICIHLVLFIKHNKSVALCSAKQAEILQRDSHCPPVSVSPSSFPLLQGARGFPGTPGLPGIKGHRVSRGSFRGFFVLDNYLGGAGELFINYVSSVCLCRDTLVLMVLRERPVLSGQRYSVIYDDFFGGGEPYSIFKITY